MWLNSIYFANGVRLASRTRSTFGNPCWRELYSRISFCTRTSVDVSSPFLKYEHQVQWPSSQSQLLEGISEHIYCSFHNLDRIDTDHRDQSKIIFSVFRSLLTPATRRDPSWNPRSVLHASSHLLSSWPWLIDKPAWVTIQVMQRCKFERNIFTGKTSTSRKIMGSAEVHWSVWSRNWPLWADSEVQTRIHRGTRWIIKVRPITHSWILFSHLPTWMHATSWLFTLHKMARISLSKPKSTNAPRLVIIEAWSEQRRNEMTIYLVMLHNARFKEYDLNPASIRHENWEDGLRIFKGK